MDTFFNGWLSDKTSHFDEGESYCPLASSMLDRWMCPFFDVTSQWPEEQENQHLHVWCNYYHNIGRHLRRYVSQIEKTVPENSTTKPNQNVNCAQEIRTLKEKQFLKTIIIIACIAFACVVPSLIFFQINGLLRLTKGNSSAAI